MKQLVEVKIKHSVEDAVVKSTKDMLYTKGWVHLKGVLHFTKDPMIIPILKTFMDDGYKEVVEGKRNKRKTETVLNGDDEGRRMRGLWELRENPHIHALCCEIE